MDSDELLLEIVAQKAAEIGARVGAETAIKTIDKERSKDRKELVDRRLRNTKLLLRNYRMFKAHAENAVYEAEEDITPMQILEDLMQPGRESTIVESVKRSVARTTILVRHMDTMIQIYHGLCDMSGSEIEGRRWRVVNALYLSEEQANPQDLAKEEGVVERVIYNDVDSATEKIAALMFGVDGIKL